MKCFNTTGVCIPAKHYMVDLTERVKEIKKLVDNGKYFIINRARQYGKTTTINALSYVLKNEKTVISLDFQGIGCDVFATGGSFAQGIARLLLDEKEFNDLSIPDGIVNELQDLNNKNTQETKLDELFRILRRWCKENEKPTVLIIDEVDSATNNQVFLDFLAQLRLQYLEREKRSDYPTFQSVILAGVTDIRHLKSKIREEDLHKVNSPWNIATDFDIDMSLSESGIKGMLDEYEADHNTGMDTAAIARSIREYTNGYPYLVSRICEIIDTNMVPEHFKTLAEAWSLYGVDETVKVLISERNALFESLFAKLTNNPEIKKRLQKILLNGETYPWLTYDEQQQQLNMYGFIRNNHNTVAVSNRIFEMLLYTHFIGESIKNEDMRRSAAANKSIFIDEDGNLDVRTIMEHFIAEHNRIHRDKTDKFLEEEGRERFITYLAPIINGTGTYTIEEQTRDQRRMDVIIHYLGRRYIIELKIWHGDRYNEKGEKQISDYLDYFGLTTGYMLSFNFNKNKKPGVERVVVGDKVLYEGTV